MQVGFGHAVGGKQFEAGSNALGRPPNALARDATRSATDAKANPLQRPAAVLPVTSCADDGGFGTLRHVVLTAVSGDTVDLSALTCGTLTLQSGAIHVDVDDLTLQGPGATALAIDGNASDRVLLHGGAGNLSIAGLAVTHGAYASDTAWGGCIFSHGSIRLTDAIVSGCTVSGGSLAIGGAWRPITASP